MNSLPLEPITPELEEQVRALAEEQNWSQIAKLLEELPPADIAQLLSHYSDTDFATLFQALPKELKPDVLAELPSDLAGELIEELPPRQTADIANEMAPDDAADVLGEVDKETSSKIIEGMDREAAAEVRQLMTYPGDSAGGIMTTELLSLNKDKSVLEALDAIASDPDEEHIYQVYVVDETQKLLGTVTIWDLLRQKNRTVKLSEIMNTEVLSVTSDTDQEEVADIISKYDLSVIPVVDDCGILLGRITHDDAADIIKEEAQEDILLLAGAEAEELGNVSAWKSCWHRIPWLLVTLFGGLLSATLLNNYTASFTYVVVLTAFIPNIMAMGGNTGVQSSVLMISEITSGSSRRHSLWRFFLHELRTGALMGLFCGIGIFICALLVLTLTGNGKDAIITASKAMNITPSNAYMCISMITGVALFLSMSISAAIGAMIPIGLYRLKIDPAVASAPFISIVIDIIAILIYYAVTFSALFSYGAAV